MNCNTNLYSGCTGYTETPVYATCAELKKEFEDNLRNPEIPEQYKALFIEAFKKFQEQYENTPDDTLIQCGKNTTYHYDPQR